MKFGIFSNNVLKIIACITMLLDHMGFILFPEYPIFRIIGRIAFPIFAFLLAEGCYYTKNKLRHFIVIAGFAVVMQTVLFVATKMTDFNIFIPFAISIALCYLVDYIERFIKEKRILISIGLIILLISSLILFYFIDAYTTYFFMNYGIYAVYLPFVLYIIRKYIKHVNIFVSIFIICITMVLMKYFTPYLYQFYGMISCVFILLYNRKKGKYNLKYLFYIFYPLHMVILYASAMFMGG